MIYADASFTATTSRIAQMTRVPSLSPSAALRVASQFACRQASSLVGHQQCIAGNGLRLETANLGGWGPRQEAVPTETMTLYETSNSLDPQEGRAEVSCPDFKRAESAESTRQTTGRFLQRTDRRAQREPDTTKQTAQTAEPKAPEKHYRTLNHHHLSEPRPQRRRRGAGGRATGCRGRR